MGGPLVSFLVMIPSWGPLTTCSEKQEAYDEEDIRALVHMHVISDEEERRIMSQGKIAGRSVAW